MNLIAKQLQFGGQRFVLQLLAGHLEGAHLFAMENAKRSSYDQEEEDDVVVDKERMGRNGVYLGAVVHHLHQVVDEVSNHISQFAHKKEERNVEECKKQIALAIEKVAYGPKIVAIECYGKTYEHGKCTPSKLKERGVLDVIDHGERKQNAPYCNVNQHRWAYLAKAETPFFFALWLCLYIFVALIYHILCE